MGGMIEQGRDQGSRAGRLGGQRPQPGGQRGRVGQGLRNGKMKGLRNPRSLGLHGIYVRQRGGEFALQPGEVGRLEIKRGRAAIGMILWRTHTAQRRHEPGNGTQRTGPRRRVQRGQPIQRDRRRRCPFADMAHDFRNGAEGRLGGWR